MNASERAKSLLDTWSATPTRDLHEAIAAAIRDAEQAALDEAIQWVEAEAQDCGCSKRIERRVRAIKEQR